MGQSILFQGTTQHTLDTKGRLALLTRHREGLVAACNGRLILTVHPHNCLLLYPEPAWDPIREKILAAPSFDIRSAALKRILIGSARDCEIDAAGRILLPPELRSRVQLGKVVWMVGMGTHFEIWSEEGLDQQRALAQQAMEHDTSRPPGFEDIAL